METPETAREVQRTAMSHSYAALFPVVQVLFMQLSSMTHIWQQSQGFWESDNIGEKVALIHSELSEFLEYHRKGDPESDHIPGLPGCSEELADVVIRVFDLAAHLGINLGDAIIAKSQFNLTRPFKHGKAY